MRLTANSRISIARGTEPPVEFGLDAAGIGAWSQSDVARTRPIPTVVGLLAVQLLDVRRGRCGFTADDNPLTAPLFFLRSGEVFAVTIRSSGLGAGKEMVTLTGPARISLTNAEGGARSYRFDLTATSVTYGTQDE